MAKASFIYIDIGTKHRLVAFRRPLILNIFCFTLQIHTWQKPASAMYEVKNASKNGSSIALSFWYLVAEFMLLQYSLRFLL